MTISINEFLAAGVLVVSISKAGWDFFISEYLLKIDEAKIKKDGKSDNALLKDKIYAAKRRRDRDSRANQITFSATTALSAWLLGIGFSSSDLDLQDVTDLQSQVSVLEQKLSDLKARILTE